MKLREPPGRRRDLPTRNSEEPTILHAATNERAGELNSAVQARRVALGELSDPADPTSNTAPIYG